MEKETKSIRIAIMGAGTVGGGVYKLLQMRKSDMYQRVGADIEIAKILVKSIPETRKDVDASLLTENFDDIMNDDSIQLVVEVMGGIEPARTFILRCLNSGKSVVSANKDLIAVHGRELLDAAEANNVDFMFEASCAGGIPIIRPLKQCLIANEITEIMGIVNGTTNYILTKMAQEGMEFEEALAKATELGYAEADPTADVEGLDAGRKMAIMGSIGFHSRITFDDVYTEGITHITSKDIKYAKDMDCVIKLLGIARNTDNGVEVRVHPTLISKEHPLASVNDVFNAVFVHGDAVDDTMFYGRGAGEMPTASAVMCLRWPGILRASALACSDALATESCRSNRLVILKANILCVWLSEIVPECLVMWQVFLETTMSALRKSFKNRQVVIRQRLWLSQMLSRKRILKRPCRH